MDNFLRPGVYIIWNQKNHMVYIGQTTILAQRLGDHYGRLVQGTHTCVELQKDWHQHGPSSFQFLIADSDSSMENEHELNMKECEWLHKYRDRCYNKMRRNSLKFFFKQAVCIDRKRFNSMLEAAETYAIELKVLENRLNDSVAWPNWIFDINNPRKGYMSKSSLPVIVWSEKNKAYKYIISCRTAAAFLKVSRQTVRRQAKDRNNSKIRFWHDLTPDEKRQIKDRPSKKFKPGYSISDNRQNPPVIYDSLSEAARKIGLSRSTLTRKAKNPDCLDFTLVNE